MAETENTVFGVPLTASQQKDIVEQETQGRSFVAPSNNDGSVTIDKEEGLASAGGAYSHRMNYGLSYKDESDLINKYRSMSLTANIDPVVDEIVNEVMSFDSDENPIEAVTDDLKVSTKIKKRIVEEFETILQLLDFSKTGDDLFRRWYIDGRLFHHIVADENKPDEGITEVRYIDPRKIKKIREVTKVKDQQTRVEVITRVEEYYVYKDERKTMVGGNDVAIKIPKEAIIYTHSGIVDEDASENTIILSFLHKAIKPWNLLNMMEDAEVIYKVSRAPERRIFYIDVGNLPKTKAEQYVTNIISKYKNKMVYDSNTGSIKDSVHHMSMLEDIWLPRREGSKGTEVSSLPGGNGLGDIENIEYFRKNLYRALHIPLTRMEGSENFSLGQTDTITRDELKFSKFIAKLRKRFASMFLDMLKIQLLLKNVITIEDWEDDISENLRFRYNLDQYFQELKEAEIRNTQLEQLGTIDEYVGRYFSIEYVQKKILKQSEDEIKDIAKQIKKEKEADLMPPDAGYDPAGAGGVEDDELPDEQGDDEDPEPAAGFQAKDEPGDTEA